MYGLSVTEVRRDMETVPELARFPLPWALSAELPPLDGRQALPRSPSRQGSGTPGTVGAGLAGAGETAGEGRETILMICSRIQMTRIKRTSDRERKRTNGMTSQGCDSPSLSKTRHTRAVTVNAPSILAV